MNKTSPFARTGIAAAFALLAGAASGADLMDSYDKALKADPSMLAADEALRAGREKAVQGRALLMPQVGLAASLLRLQNKSSTSLQPPLADLVKSDGGGTLHEAAVQMVQPLYDAKASAEKKQFEQQAGLAGVQHRHASQELMQRVAESYFGVLLAQEHLRVAQAEKAAVAMQRDRAQARFDVGRGKITDLQEAQARYDSVATREISARSSLAQREAQYRELTGAPATGLAPLAAGFAPVPPQPDSLEAWQARGMEQNTRVQTRQGELAIATAEIDKYRLRSRPTLELVASYTLKGQNGGLAPAVSPDSQRSAAVGLQLSVPLFAGGAIDSRLRESGARRNQAEQELDAARRDARLQVQDAFLAVKTGVSRIGALEQSVKSARTALEATTLGRDLGSRTELDVLDAQQRMFNAQLELAQGRNDYLLGRIRLAAAAGDLQESDLRILNTYLAR